jgi:NAD(P)-dependent dehydrogenase (short-subunit alcohol dehydrogenase family)
MMLKDKVAVIYGAAGAVGSTAAQAFAREGARVFSHWPVNIKTQ